MKKLITIIFVAALLLSCSKDEPTPTTYQLVNAMESDSDPDFQYLDGTLWEVTVFCLDKDGDVVREDNLQPIPAGGGKSESKELTANIEKLVVSFKLLPKQSEYYDLELNYRMYTVTRFVIVPETENEFKITDSTNVKGTLTKANRLNSAIKTFEIELN